MREVICADRRILRTRKLLRVALIELLKEKPITKITPTELCRRADINRNTFYSHYASPEELLAELENGLCSSVEKAIVNCQSAHESIVATCHALRKDKDLCSVLYTENASPSFSSKIYALSSQRIFKKMERETNNMTGNYPAMLSCFAFNGSAAVISFWVKNGMEEEPEEIAGFIEKLCKSGIQSLTH